jgi:aspartate aminotransferase
MLVRGRLPFRHDPDLDLEPVMSPTPTTYRRGPVAERIRAAPTSATVRIADLAKTLKRSGVDVVDFSAGRAAEGTPDYICQAASEALLGGDTHQTMAQGKPEYRQACATKLLRENGIEADPETEIIASFGCKNGLALALLAVMDPGDEIIVEDPGFVSYAPTIQFFGGVPVPVPLRSEDDHRWREEDLRAAVTDRTRAILFCSPHNPTGVVHRPEELDMIARVAEEYDLYVISDEIYERITWGGREHVCIASRAGMAGRSITLMGLTKTASMGGWRIGFVYAPPPVVEAMVTLQQHLATCVGSFTQVGGAVAFGREPEAALTAMWQEWEERCEYMTRELDRMPGVRCGSPEGGFYGWADIRATGESSEELAERLLRDHHVALVPGSAFGPQGEGFLRITCVKSRADLEEGIRRLREALDR